MGEDGYSSPFFIRLEMTDKGNNKTVHTFQGGSLYE